MSRTGVVTDIHGNLVALDAVLADAESQAIERWFVLGDLVAVGPDPVGTVERLQALPNATFVRGNTERYLTDTDTDRHGMAWTRAQLGTARLDWLRTMPLHARFDRTLLVHASPGRDDGVGLDFRLRDDQLRVLVRGCDADLVLVGHTHRHFDRTVDGVRIVNPGSVGNAIEPDGCAGWAVVDGDDIDLRRVAYDRDAVIAQAEASGNPVIDGIIAHLRGERIFTDQPLDVDITEYEPPLEAKRA
jgi:putative phosphoesterase